MIMLLYASLNAIVVFDLCHRMPNRPSAPIPDANMPALLRCISRGDAFSCRGILSRVVGFGRGGLVGGAVLLMSGDESASGSVFLCSGADICVLVGGSRGGLSLRFSVGETDCTLYGCL